jgi:hypothetical protein
MALGERSFITWRDLDEIFDEPASGAAGLEAPMTPDYGQAPGYTWFGACWEDDRRPLRPAPFTRLVALPLEVVPPRV